MEQLSWRCRAFWNFPGFRIACCLAGLALLASGCGGTREAAQRQANYSHVVTPQPPAFLTGPGAMLLTNWSGFSARVEVGNSVSLENNSSGQLLGNGSKLMYAPQAGENTD